jgi:hypothetical protein
MIKKCQSSSSSCNSLTNVSIHLRPSAFMYEVTGEGRRQEAGGRRTIIDVDGKKWLSHAIHMTHPMHSFSTGFCLTAHIMIAQVGNYYHCLRQRPDKKGSNFEYIPNKKYAYRDVKRTLAQLKISVLPSRMWNESHSLF